MLLADYVTLYSFYGLLSVCWHLATNKHDHYSGIVCKIFMSWQSFERNLHFKIEIYETF